MARWWWWFVALTACGRVNFDAIGAAGDGGSDGPGQPIDLAFVDTGGRHVCGLDGAGTAYCWGDNAAGQLGMPGVPRLATPTALGAWTAISAGDAHTCGIRAGMPWCWGNNVNGQVDGVGGATITTPTPVMLPTTGLPTFDRIEAGTDGSCAIGGGQLWCWGRAQVNGTGAAAPTPARVGTSAAWSAVSMGLDHACGIDGGVVRCWGANDNGQGGSGIGPDQPTPVAVSLPFAATAISAGYSATCAIAGGALWCWGRRENVDTMGGVVLPTQLGSSTAWTAVSTAYLRTCGIDGGQLKCWGRTGFGELGDSRWTSLYPLDGNLPIGSADAISISFSSDVAIETVGIGCMRAGPNVSCWGGNFYGELGNGTFAMETTPVEVSAPNGRPWMHVVGGSEHVCATTDDRTLFCWGLDTDGQVTSVGAAADGTCPTACAHPRPVAGPVATADELVAGDNYTCARAGATIRCWGNHFALGSDGPEPLTNLVAPVGQWSRLIGGPRATCGITSTNALYCWGIEAGSQTPALVSSPEMHDINGISYGYAFSCAVRSIDSARVCVGNNTEYEIGNGSMVDVAQPTAYDVGSVSSVAAWGYHACALSPTGTISCWGTGMSSEHGQPGYIVTTPTAVVDASGTLGSCTQLTGASDHTCMLCSGRIFCLGRNGAGECGTGTLEFSDYHARPVVLPASTFVDVTARAGGGCALDTTGRMFCWGAGPHGQLGNGTMGTNHPTPVLR